MSIPQRPKRLIGSTRYGVALEPKSTTFSPTISGTVYFFDGKHAIETRPFSSLDQLAKMCYNFWEGTIAGQLNFRRFSFWFSEFLSDFGIQDINEDKLEEELLPLNTGVALKRTGHKIREAKVVYDEPVKPSLAEKPSSYRSLLSSPGVPVREAKVVYHEPVVESKSEPSVIRKEKDYSLGETAADVRARLKSTGVPIREAKVIPTPIEQKETAPVRKLQPAGSFKDIRKIETSSEPKDKKVEPVVHENVLPLPKKRFEPQVDKLTKPSEILDRGPTKSPKVQVLPPLKREESKRVPPDKNLLKPSEVVKEKETIFDKERKMFEIDVREDDAPSERLLKPSEYLRKRETIPVVSRTVGVAQDEKKEHTLLRPSEVLKKKKDETKEKLLTKETPPHQEKILTIKKPTQNQLDKVSKPKQTIDSEIPTPMKIDEESNEVSQFSLVDVPGIGESKAELLKEAGFETVDKLANASIDELVKIKGIGPATAEKYITNAKKLLGK
ncbi:MAG: helix-hairpin-helix domain-containing protein [Candidatus Heimdallarchaeum aukensis]|uniref:Helix-hairpin-helix domain-containing protein n=1 Tax=Candidatus Heimdallarchaeum aukensis TaxID=2876573 RepID=A0A9Y1BMN9_9ARCH|nr:MAG: helix-hairpin-helix domain-containing protein [Candidatus Heimdallarchaeum aukensis]